jgi:hypothetical protein
MRGGFIYEYEKLNSDDQKVVRRWLCINVVIGALLLAGLIALALKVPDDQSEATAQHATMNSKLPPEPALLPSR